MGYQKVHARANKACKKGLPEGKCMQDIFSAFCIPKTILFSPASVKWADESCVCKISPALVKWAFEKVKVWL